MRGFLIDCYLQNDKIVLWIKTGNNDLFLFGKVIPKLYADYSDRLYSKLLEQSLKPRKLERKLLSQDSITVLEIATKPDDFARTVRFIDEFMEYDCQLYNADIPLAQLYMYDNGLFPFSEIEFSYCGNNIKTIRCIDKNNFDCKIPKLKSLHIQLIPETDIRIDFNARIKEITIGNKELIGESEKDLLSEFVQIYRADDPDIVLIHRGDFFIPYFKSRFIANNISFEFGRLPDMIAMKKGRSFFSYGRILYKESSSYFRGRIHIDSSCFMYKEAGFEGILEVSRICRLLIQKTARASPGTAISNLQVYQAYREGFLIPYKKNQVEMFKTGLELHNADRAGIIYEPIAGLHMNTAEIDFSSMYPSIMVNKNISPETVICTCCRDNRVPGIGFNICEKRIGLIPKVLKPILEARNYYKKNLTPLNMKRSTALKWILVTSFGYTGYKNAKFGRIESHEAINAFSRELMLEASRVAEQKGFEIIHGIIDSLWIKKNQISRRGVLEVCREISRKTGILMCLEGIYRWIVFLPSLNDLGLPVLTRFYGVFRNNKIKVRGVEIRRRDSPKIVKDMQMDVLLFMRDAESESAFLSRIPSAVTILKAYINKLKNNPPPHELTMKKRLFRTDYSSNVVQKIVFERLRKKGIHLFPGESAEFIIQDADSPVIFSRFVPVQDYRGRFDFEKYKELLVKAFASLFLPFGYDVEKVYSLIRPTRQLTLSEFDLDWKNVYVKFDNVQKRIENYI